MNDVVILNLDRPRKLRYTYSALKTLCAMTGVNLLEIDSKVTNADLDFIEKMVYCGILKDAQENGETLTLEKVSELLDLVSPIEVFQKVAEAFRAAFPTSESSGAGVSGESAGEKTAKTGKKR